MNKANGNGMRAGGSMNVLNGLLTLLQYSLASYLRYARPWAHPPVSP